MGHGPDGTRPPATVAAFLVLPALVVLVSAAVRQLQPVQYEPTRDPVVYCERRPGRVGSIGSFVVPGSLIGRRRVEALASVPIPGLVALERENRLLHSEELVTLPLDCRLDGKRAFGDLRQVLQRFFGASDQLFVLLLLEIGQGGRVLEGRPGRASPLGCRPAG